MHAATRTLFLDLSYRFDTIGVTKGDQLEDDWQLLIGTHHRKWEWFVLRFFWKLFISMLKKLNMIKIIIKLHLNKTFMIEI